MLTSNNTISIVCSIIYMVHILNFISNLQNSPPILNDFDVDHMKLSSCSVCYNMKYFTKFCISVQLALCIKVAGARYITTDLCSWAYFNI